MDILTSNITNMKHQIEAAVPMAYHPLMEFSAIPSWDALHAVERMEVEEALSIPYEPVIETHQGGNFCFRAVNHGIS